MLEIKFVRQNLSTVQEAMTARGHQAELDTLKKGDDEHRKILKEKLQEFLKKYAVNCYRYKGFVQAKDPTSFMVQGVFNDFTLKEIPPYNGPTELVLIGEMETEENVQTAFQHYCQ